MQEAMSTKQCTMQAKPSTSQNNYRARRGRTTPNRHGQAPAAAEKVLWWQGILPLRTHTPLREGRKSTDRGGNGGRGGGGCGGGGGRDGGSSGGGRGSSGRSGGCCGRSSCSGRGSGDGRSSGGYVGNPSIQWMDVGHQNIDNHACANLGNPTHAKTRKKQTSQGKYTSKWHTLRHSRYVEAGPKVDAATGCHMPGV